MAVTCGGEPGGSSTGESGTSAGASAGATGAASGVGSGAASGAFGSGASGSSSGSVTCIGPCCPTARTWVVTCDGPCLLAYADGGDYPINCDDFCNNSLGGVLPSRRRRRGDLLSRLHRA